MKLPGPLLVITDRKRAQRPLAEVVEAALRGGCRWVLLREKDLPSDALALLAAELGEIASRYTAMLCISGDPALAARCSAGGVHLPRDGSVAAARQILDGRALIGISTHSVSEAQAAVEMGADYITLSPVFITPSKPGYGPALGLDALNSIARRVPIPVVALGGVTAANAASCVAAGAAGVAMMGAVMQAQDPGRVVSQTLAALATSSTQAK